MDKIIYRIDRGNPNTSTRFVRREGALRAMASFKWGDCLTLFKGGREVEIYAGFRSGVAIKTAGVYTDDTAPEIALADAEAMLA